MNVHHRRMVDSSHWAHGFSSSMYGRWAYSLNWTEDAFDSTCFSFSDNNSLCFDFFEERWNDFLESWDE